MQLIPVEDNQLKLNGSFRNLKRMEIIFIGVDCSPSQKLVSVTPPFISVISYNENVYLFVQFRGKDLFGSAVV